MPKNTKQHKPEPLEFDADTVKIQGEGFGVRVYLTDRNIGGVAEIYTDNDSSERVKALLVAAPDLLEAAKAALSRLEGPAELRQEEAGADFDVVYGKDAPAVLALRAAITKAGGF